MTFRKSSLFSLGALLVLSASTLAAEELAKGMSVAREMVARDGHRFLFTVTPPTDRGVDPRIFDLFELGDRDENGPKAIASAKTDKDPEPGELEALDLSDYRIRVEAVALASCSIQVPYLKFNKVSLNGGKQVIIDSFGASALFVSVYPVKGDVDALTSFGPNDTVCSVSAKGGGQFDFAKCFDSTCNPTGGLISGFIFNPLSSQAQFVGAVSVAFSN